MSWKKDVLVGYNCTQRCYGLFKTTLIGVLFQNVIMYDVWQVGKFLIAGMHWRTYASIEEFEILG